MGKTTETSHTQKSNNRKVTLATKLPKKQTQNCKESVQKYAKTQQNQHFIVFGTTNALYMTQR
jgi:hypothetical protein